MLKHTTLAAQISEIAGQNRKLQFDLHAALAVSTFEANSFYDGIINRPIGHHGQLHLGRPATSMGFLRVSQAGVLESDRHDYETEWTSVIPGGKVGYEPPSKIGVVFVMEKVNSAGSSYIMCRLSEGISRIGALGVIEYLTTELRKPTLFLQRRFSVLEQNQLDGMRSAAGAILQKYSTLDASDRWTRYSGRDPIIAQLVDAAMATLDCEIPPNVDADLFPWQRSASKNFCAIPAISFRPGQIALRSEDHSFHFVMIEGISDKGLMIRKFDDYSKSLIIPVGSPVDDFIALPG